jgi:hypothetical protein
LISKYNESTAQSNVISKVENGDLASGIVDEDLTPPSGMEVAKV